MKNAILSNIVKVIRSSNGICSTDIAKSLRLDRHTISKYLEVLKTNGVITFKKIGMAKVWYPSESQILSLLENNDELSNSLKQFLDSFDNKVHIIDKNMRLIYVNEDNNLKKYNKTTIKCYKLHKGGKALCKSCAVDETLRTGEKRISLIRGKTNLKLTVIPIKNYKNETTAVIEVMSKIEDENILGP